MNLNNETFPDTSIPLGQVSRLGRERTLHDYRERFVRLQTTRGFEF